MTFNDAVRDYEKRGRAMLRPRTWSNRRSLLRQLCAVFGDRPLITITEADFEAYAARRLVTVKPVSVNSELRAFATVRAWMARHKCEVGAAPRPLRAFPALRIRSWSPAQVDHLMTVIAELSPAIGPIVYTLANTGMRCGEALALRWDRVDFERRLLCVWPREDWTTKSGRPREVPINDELLAFLRSLPRTSIYVFPTRNGRRYARWPQLAFDRARTEAGLRGGPHTLRHSYATEFLARGGTLEMLAQILGHSDQRVTRIYAHLRPDHLAAARNIVRLGKRPE